MRAGCDSCIKANATPAFAAGYGGRYGGGGGPRKSMTAQRGDRGSAMDYYRQ